MKLLRILVFLLCCSLSIWAQTDKITDGILEQSALLIHSDIARGEKQALFFTQNQSNKGNTIKAFLILADAAYLKGDYAAVMKNLYAADTIQPDKDQSQYQIEKKLAFARYYRLFGFNELSEQNRAEALQLLHSGNFKRNQLWIQYYYENALAENTNQLVELQKAEGLVNLTKTLHKTPIQYEMLLRYTALFRESDRFDLSEEAIEAILSEQSPNVFTARAMLELALLKRRTAKPSMQYLLEADRLLDQHTDVQTQMEVSQLLSEEFLQKNEVNAYKKYVDKHKMLNIQRTRSLKEARDVIITHLETAKKGQVSGFNYYWVAAGLLVLLLCSGIYFYAKTKKDYQKFLAAVEKANEPEPTPTRQMAIPQKTEQALLEKLAKFEKSNRFTNPNLTIITLAKSLDTNTKYLSEIINKNKDANFNQYINDLRISYIIGKMKEDPKYLNYKIYYLAKECGFSSQSTFSTVFRASTGISPLSFIKFLKNESKPIS